VAYLALCAGDWVPFLAAIDPEVHWQIAAPERQLDSAQGIFVSPYRRPSTQSLSVELTLLSYRTSLSGRS
jgi:hypothetical protein